MSDANTTSKSKKGLVCAIASAVFLIAIAVTVASIEFSSHKNNSSVVGLGPTAAEELDDEIYTIDLQSYDNEEKDPKHECKHAELSREKLQEIMHNFRKDKPVTAIFHQDSDVAYSFDRHGVGLTGDEICFDTFESSRFCFDLPGLFSNVSSVALHPPNDDGHRRAQTCYYYHEGLPEYDPDRHDYHWHFNAQDSCWYYFQYSKYDVDCYESGEYHYAGYFEGNPSYDAWYYHQYNYNPYGPENTDDWSWIHYAVVQYLCTHGTEGTGYTCYGCDW